MFQAKRFLADAFGNAAKVRSFLTAYGFEAPKEDTIYKWFARGSVPADWIIVLLAVLELDQGKPVSVAGYVRRMKA